jgi:hypothetical protein
MVFVSFEKGFNFQINEGQEFRSMACIVCTMKPKIIFLKLGYLIATPIRIIQLYTCGIVALLFFFFKWLKPN